MKLRNSGLKANSIVTVMAMAVAVLILIAVFVLPEIITGRLEKKATPLLDAALSSAHAGDFETAYSAVSELNSLFSSYENRLNLFSHHKDVSLMIAATQSAMHLSIVEDSANLIQKLGDVRYLLEYICSANDISFVDII